MPLKNGSSKQTISANVAELVGHYKDEGHIGTKAGKKRKQAPQQAKRA